MPQHWTVFFFLSAPCLDVPYYSIWALKWIWVEMGSCLNFPEVNQFLSAPLWNYRYFPNAVTTVTFDMVVKKTQYKNDLNAQSHKTRGNGNSCTDIPRGNVTSSPHVFLNFSAHSQIILSEWTPACTGSKHLGFPPAESDYGNFGAWHAHVDALRLDQCDVSCK